MPPQQKNGVRDKVYSGSQCQRFLSITVGRGLVALSSPHLDARKQGCLLLYILFPPFNYNWVLRLRNGAPPHPLVNPVCLENPPRHAQKCASLSSRHFQASQVDDQDYRSHLPWGLTDGPHPGVLSALTGQPLVSLVGPQFRHFS